jgi:hypothetical protein
MSKTDPNDAAAQNACAKRLRALAKKRKADIESDRARRASQSPFMLRRQQD